MVQALKVHWIATVCVLFVLINAAFIAKEIYWFSALPAVLLVIWAMFTSVNNLVLFIAFATPLSINLEEMDLGGLGIALPTEPLLVGLMLLMLLKISVERNVISGKVLRHPITWVIMLQLTWMFICILPSSMPLVSFKYFTARLWFVVTMFFLVTRVFEDERNMQRFIWAYISGLCIVIIYTLTKHAQFSFAHEPAHWVMEPFFKDHTSYGAIIAFFLPFGITALWLPGRSAVWKSLALLMLVLLTAGLIFSYTRAAWVSLVGALGVFIFMKLRIPLWSVAAVLIIGGGVYFANEEQITLALASNTEESSDDLGQHVQSISNISSDASNLERINRWNSALRMFEEKPLFGWGPGTYMFQYAPFQASEDRTIISTNFGVQGNAHSEYLGPLSEQGVLGFLLMAALVLVTLITAVHLHYRMPPGADRAILMALILGLVTYYLHGGLNNFLDTDKASVPFWAFTAMIVLLDLKYPRATKS